jgi:catechol 2,3-dioxygenase-like lactoylglutathione lyase family enzyme
MAAPRIFRVILPVNDIELAAKFYADLLGGPGVRVSPGRHYFDCGGVILACFHPKADGDGWEARPNQDHIYFAVKNLESYHRRAAKLGALQKGDVHGEASGEIVKRPWGERSFYGQDPFGNLFCFVDEKTLFTGKRRKL